MADLVADCGLAPEHAALLLAALAGIGLVDAVVGGRYRAACPDIAGLAAWMDNGAALAGVLSGATRVGVEDPTQAAVVNSGATGHLGVLLAAAAAAAAAHLDGLVPDAADVLDVGAGAAPWTLALARRRPRCRFTAVDLEPVLDTTRRAVAAAHLDGRFTYLSGDAFELAVPGAAFDLIVLANVVHLFDDSDAERLLRRLRPALRVGGHVALVEVLASEPGEQPDPVVAVYALGLLARAPHGLVRPYSGLRASLERTGYSGVRRIDLDAQPPLSLVIAVGDDGRP